MKKRFELIVLVLFALSIFALTINFNGIFSDEEYVITIGKFMLDGNSNALGNPLQIAFSFYPIFSCLALASSMGGIIAARFLNSIIITAVIVVIYFTAKRLSGDRRTPIIAFAISLFFAPIFFVARFATADALSLFFLALSVFFMFSEKSRKNLGLAAVLLFASFLAKYTSAIAAPALIIFTLLRDRKKSVYFIVPYVLFSVIYFVIFYGDLINLLHGQLDAQSGFSIANVLFMTGTLLPYGIMCYFNGKKSGVLIMWLGVASFIIFQSTVLNNINTFKHTAFAFVLIAPFAASGLFNLLNRKKFTWNRALAVFLVVFCAVIFLASNYYIERIYPNEERASQVMDSIVEPGDMVLVEGGSYRYYTKKINFTNVITDFWFDYNGDGLSTQQDYVLAIGDGKFKAVMTTNYFAPDRNFDGIIASGAPYKIIYEENQELSYDSILIRVYERTR
jgi:hypothetical protein